MKDSKRGGNMRKVLQYPNTLAAVKELLSEIAQELGIQNLDKVQKDRYDIRNQIINKRLTDRARFSIIRFR